MRTGGPCMHRAQQQVCGGGEPVLSDSGRPCCCTSGLGVECGGRMAAELPLLLSTAKSRACYGKPDWFDLQRGNSGGRE